MNEVAVITGTTHGIGRVTSRELARAGRTVVMLCRDVAAGHLVRDEIAGQIPGAALHVVHCDLASLASVRESAEVVRGTFGAIGLLINNAGMVSSRHRMSADGFELTFATNHLGPFLLTALLSDRLSDTARIINVASRVHYRGRIDFGPHYQSARTLWRHGRLRAVEARQRAARVRSGAPLVRHARMCQIACIREWSPPTCCRAGCASSSR